MVTLVVGDLEQITILEYLLTVHGIEFKTELDDGRYGLETPYLLVYNAPLDARRAIKWIMHREEDCYCE